MLITALAIAPAVATQQTVAFTNIVPKGWLIGVAVNQNQTEGRDTVGVELVTRPCNSITPENLLKRRQK